MRQSLATDNAAWITRATLGRHTPQLLPARVFSLTMAMLEQPARTASTMSLRPTSQQKHTVGPRGDKTPLGRPASRRNRSEGPSTVPRRAISQSRPILSTVG